MPKPSKSDGYATALALGGYPSSLATEYLVHALQQAGVLAECPAPQLFSVRAFRAGAAAILAIASLANLPVNIAGALLMLLALILFLADLKANTHGILSFGGVVSLILGMAFLINTGPVGLGVNPVVIFGSAAITFGFFVFFVDRILRSRRQPVLTGPDALVGALGEAREELRAALHGIEALPDRQRAAIVPVRVGQQRSYRRRGLRRRMAGRKKTCLAYSHRRDHGCRISINHSEHAEKHTGADGCGRVHVYIRGAGRAQENHPARTHEVYVTGFG